MYLFFIYKIELLICTLKINWIVTCNCHKTQPVMSIALATFSRCRHLGAAVNGAPKCTSKQAEPICHHLIQNHRPTYCTLVCLWFAIANPHFDLCALHVKAIVINICCGTRGFKLRDPICLHPDHPSEPPLWSVNQLFDQSWSINSLSEHWLRSAGHPKAVTHHTMAWRTRIPNQIVWFDD